MHQPTCQTISIHAPTRGATGVTRVKNYGSKFQSTLPREERLQALPLSDRLCHFNPRSHERSDTARQPGGYLCIISIHAPTRGATTSVEALSVSMGISIHAPTRGATLSLRISNHSLSISIHAPTRGATYKESNFNSYNFISIHAPTRGATSSGSCHSGTTCISIHAPTRGATIMRATIT